MNLNVISHDLHVTVSAKTHLVCTTSDFFSSALSLVSKERIIKVSFYIVLDNRKSKEIVCTVVIY